MTEKSSTTNLVIYPDPLLRQATAKIERFGEEVAAKAEGMLELMYRYKGIGLAGPQVGLSKKIVVINPSGQQADELILVNPQIASFSGEEVVLEEGCLSFPGIYTKIVRPQSVSCVAATLDGREVKYDFNGLLAQIVQHEVDHLTGVLLVDRMSAAERKAHQRDLRHLRKEYKRKDASV